VRRPASDQRPKAIRLAVRRQGLTTLIAATGELSRDSTGELDRVLSTHVRSGGRVVLDLRAIAFIDASGIDVLLRAKINARAAGTDFSLTPGAAVRRIPVLSSPS
jgi:stage II sporulation protein AA (anti-sigma F factor antagonist)